MVMVAMMFGSNDIGEAKKFYDVVLATIGLKGVMEHGSGGRIYGNKTGPLLSIVRPYDGCSATAGNGSMASFICDSREQVIAIHAKALERGGRDEGTPGPRSGGDGSVFAAYFRDLDGNKICAISV